MAGGEVGVSAPGGEEKIEQGEREEGRGRNWGWVGAESGRGGPIEHEHEHEREHGRGGGNQGSAVREIEHRVRWAGPDVWR